MLLRLFDRSIVGSVIFRFISGSGFTVGRTNFVRNYFVLFHLDLIFNSFHCLLKLFDLLLSLYVVDFLLISSDQLNLRLNVRNNSSEVFANLLLLLL